MREFRIKYILKNIKPPFEDKEIELNKASITEFYFVENIENMFLTGKLSIVDQGGFFETLPLTGEETIEVTIEQNLEDTEDSINVIKIIEFEILKTPIRDIETLDTVTYDFFLVEKGYYEYFRKKYSISFSQKKISEIVNDICKRQLKLEVDDYEIEDTIDRIDYIIPYWKPVVTIKDLVKKARRSKSPIEGGFLYYSTTDVETKETPTKKFISFASLLEQKIDSNINKRFYFKKKDINQSFINIIKESRNTNYNNRSILNKGIAGKKYYSIDLLNDKKVIETEKTYTNFINKSTLLGKKSYLSLELDEIDSDVKFLGNLDSNLVKANIDHNFRMQLEDFNKREIVMGGLLDRYAGRKVYIEEMSDNNGQTYNERDTGEWLIKAITHYFSINQFEQKITIIKDAFSDIDVEGHQQI